MQATECSLFIGLSCLLYFIYIYSDGVIEATIDHENGWLLSNEQIDIYSTEEPQKALHK